jgi:hypothetical protein
MFKIFNLICMSLLFTTFYVLEVFNQIVESPNNQIAYALKIATKKNRYRLQLHQTIIKILNTGEEIKLCLQISVLFII